ncbi:MAG: hypothetical protein AAB511_01795 [Patescibacteria group bacterium]
MNYYTLQKQFLAKMISVVALSALLGGFLGLLSNAMITNAQASGSPTFSSVAAVPNAATLHAGQTLEVYFSEANGATDLTLNGACTINGVAVTELQNLTGGLYRVNYLIGASDPEANAGAVPINCTLQNSGGGSTTITAFTDGNTVAIDTNSNGTIDPPASGSFSFSSVTTTPNSGLLTLGQNLDIYLQETNNNNTLTIGGACTINNVDISQFDVLGNGQYRIRHTITEHESDQAPGAVPFSCRFGNSSGSHFVTVTALTAASSVGIDVNGNGTIEYGHDAAAITISSVAAVPNSGTIHAGQSLDVYFQESHNYASITLGSSCTVNGVEVSPLHNLTGGLYKVVYTVGANDSDRAAGTVPINCILANGTSTVTVTAFTDNNTLAIDVDGGNGGGGTFTFSSVAAVPNTGTLTAGQNLQVYFQESTNNATLTLGSSCTVNGVAMSPLQNLTGGLYKVVYTIGANDTDRAAGTIPVNCMFNNSAGGSATVVAFTDNNTVAIDANGSGNEGSTDDGNIDGDVEGGSNPGNGTLDVTSITQVESVATANGTFENGWVWTFNVTVPTSETSLQMKFGNWTHSNGTNTIAAANNIRISSQQATATSTVTITAANTYATPALVISGDMDSNQPGRQIQVKVEARVPSGSLNGSYTTNWGILTTE